MVQSIVITSRLDSNTPKMALIMKREDHHKSVLIVQYGDGVVWLDPIVMSRGSILVRNYHLSLLFDNPMDDFSRAVMEASFSVGMDPIFSNPRQKIIYNERLAGYLRTLPKGEIASFCKGALNLAMEEIHGNHVEITAREKQLMRENTELINRLRKRALKKKAKPIY